MTWPPTAEVDVCKIVIAELECRGYEVFQEVEFYGQRADLVAQKDGTTTIIEVKARLGLDGLAQAEYWVRVGAANYVWFVVPETKRKKSMRSRSWNLAERLCLWRGVGLGVIHKPGYYYRKGQRVRPTIEEIEPELRFIAEASVLDEPKNPIASILRPEHKEMGEAGGNGGHFTQFRLTCTRIKAYVDQHPGCTIGEAVAAIEHHYASRNSAVGALRERGSRGVIDGVEARFEKGRWRFYPTCAELSS